MLEFADRTGLTSVGNRPTRYLWTDSKDDTHWPRRKQIVKRAIQEVKDSSSANKALMPKQEKTWSMIHIRQKLPIFPVAG